MKHIKYYPKHYNLLQSLLPMPQAQRQNLVEKQPLMKRKKNSMKNYSACISLIWRLCDSKRKSGYVITNFILRIIPFLAEPLFFNATVG
jgi:hypothetical protein